MCKWMLWKRRDDTLTKTGCYYTDWEKKKKIAPSLKTGVQYPLLMLLLLFFVFCCCCCFFFVKRVTVINEYEEGGLRMIDHECMVKSLILVWLRRIFSEVNGPWKSFLQPLLSPTGDFFSFGLQLQHIRLYNSVSILLWTRVLVVRVNQCPFPAILLFNKTGI